MYGKKLLKDKTTSAQRSRRLTESSPTGLSSNTRLAQLRQHVRQAPATLYAMLKKPTRK